ncbi:MAG: hypothetical protein R3C54_01455 [Parvularculaceae bacterium]
MVIAGAGVSGFTAFSWRPSRSDPPKASGDDEPRELYNTRNKPKADALSILPASYDQMPAPKPAIELDRRFRDLGALAGGGTRSRD